MNLDVVIYRAGQPWAEPKLDAFVEGLRQHGIEPEQRRAEDWRVSDLAVVWAHRDVALHNMQGAAGKHYLVLERGYIGDIENRRRWTSAGFDGLNGRADFCNEDVGPDRWQKHFGDAMQPWKDDGDYALLMGQVRGDASLVGVDIEDWYTEAAQALSGLGWTVMFRPHPRDRMQAPDGAYVLESSLDSALEGAALVVTWNSNSGVDAVLAGVPTVAMDRGSMAYRVSAHEYSERFTPNRDQWAFDLAYTQWRENEIRSGLAWEHLRGGLECLS